jgi:ABC-2 type transport system ATP-binding protein
MSENVIATRGLTVYYGRHRGIADLELAVREGEVYGFLGPNGAGKTTTQRVLMDIIRPTAGQATIFGLDCQEEGVQIRERVGYLPGELQLPGGMRGRSFLETMASIRGDRDSAYRDELCERLDLDTGRRIREYSRGNKQKLGLVAALMHKPALLILDEPTSGLDPLMQQTVLEMVRETRQEGRTVFFSSHILSEVQAVCDRVGIIREGKLVAVERVDDLIRQQFRRLRFTFAETPAGDAFAFPGVAELNRIDHNVTLEIRENLQPVMERAVQYGILDIEAQPVTLEEIFLAYYGRENGGNDA